MLDILLNAYQLVSPHELNFSVCWVSCMSFISLLFEIMDWSSYLESWVRVS